MSDLASIASAATSAVSAIVAIVLAVVTYKYLVATREIREATLRSVEEARLQREDSARPVVVAELIEYGGMHQSGPPHSVQERYLGKDSAIYLRFSNIGAGPALNLIASADVQMSKYNVVSLTVLANASLAVGGEAHLTGNNPVAGAELMQDQEGTRRAKLVMMYLDIYGRQWRTLQEIAVSIPEPETQIMRLGEPRLELAG
jgi:hypothetical protein